MHILLKQSHSVLQTKHLEEECLAKLNKFRTYFSNTIRGFELRKEKYKQLSSGPNRHSYLLNVKQILNHEDMENDEATLRNVMKFMFNLNEYSKFVTHKFRSDM